MNNLRLDTAGVLASGILNREAPKTGIPEDREHCEATDDNWSFVGAEKIAENIDKGLVVGASNYYGIPYAWRDGDKYKGILLQYRQVTEDETFDTAAEAAEWFEEKYYATDG